MFEKICIVGNSKLQNQLLSNYIRSSIGLECINCAKIKGAFIPSPPEVVCLYLWDFDNNDINEIWTLLPIPSNNSDKKSPVAIFNIDSNSDQFSDFLRCGVRGFFYKNGSLEFIAKGIMAIKEGELWVPRKQLENCIFESEKVIKKHNWRDVGLTRREVEVLARIASGNTNEEIAENLFISIHTVKTHNYRIFKKIGANNRIQASLWALKYSSMLSDTITSNKEKNSHHHNV